MAILKPTLIVFCVEILFLVACSSQPSKLGENPVTDPSPNSSEIKTKYLPIEEFWDQFRERLLSSDSIGLVKLIHFPLNGLPRFIDRDGNGIDSSEFFKNYDIIFNDDVVKKIMLTEVKDFELQKSLFKDLQLDNDFLHYARIVTYENEELKTFPSSLVMAIGEIGGQIKVVRMSIAG